MQSGICRRRKRKSCPKKTEPALKPCCRPVALFGGKSASVRRRMPDCRVMPLHAFNHGQTVSFAVFPVAGENIRFLRDAGYDVVERASAEAMTNAVLPATLRHACRFLRKIKKYGDEETFSGCKSTSGFVMRFVCRRMRKGRRVRFGGVAGTAGHIRTVSAACRWRLKVFIFQSRRQRNKTTPRF